MWPGPWHSDLGMEAWDQAPPCPFPGAAPGKPLTPELIMGGQFDMDTFLRLSASLPPQPRAGGWESGEARPLEEGGTGCSETRDLAGEGFGERA